MKYRESEAIAPNEMNIKGELMVTIKWIEDDGEEHYLSTDSIEFLSRWSESGKEYEYVD